MKYATFSASKKPLSTSITIASHITPTPRSQVRSYRRHCIYLNELRAEIYNICGVSLSQTTLLHTFYITLSAHALERNDLMQPAFMNKIADEVPNQICSFSWMRLHATGGPLDRQKVGH
jgi:hypothetical protein